MNISWLSVQLNLKSIINLLTQMENENILILIKTKGHHFHIKNTKVSLKNFNYPPYTQMKEFFFAIKLNQHFFLISQRWHFIYSIIDRDFLFPHFGCLMCELFHGSMNKYVTDR